MAYLDITYFYYYAAVLFGSFGGVLVFISYWNKAALAVWIVRGLAKNEIEVPEYTEVKEGDVGTGKYTMKMVRQEVVTQWERLDRLIIDLAAKEAHWVRKVKEKGATVVYYYEWRLANELGEVPIWLHDRFNKRTVFVDINARDNTPLELKESQWRDKKKREAMIAEFQKGRAVRYVGSQTVRVDLSQPEATGHHDPSIAGRHYYGKTIEKIAAPLLDVGKTRTDYVLLALMFALLALFIGLMASPYTGVFSQPIGSCPIGYDCVRHVVNGSAVEVTSTVTSTASRFVP